MKKCIVIIIVTAVCLANGESAREVIAQVGDMTSVLGPAGKNICVSEDGSDIAIIYGPPSDPYNPAQPFACISIAYSTNSGSSWSLYGPFGNNTPPFSRIYPGVDGAYYVWQEDNHGLYTATAIDHLPNSLGCWMPCIGFNPDDPMQVLITSKINSGNNGNYMWLSTDGGNTWSDTTIITNSGTAGHFRWGTGNYALFTYHDTYNTAEYPYYIETTNGGNTWTSPAILPAITSNTFWWTGLDCEVINNLPFAAHDDVAVTGVMQLFYPNPDNPGNPGTWNWIALNVDSVGAGSFVYHDTTWTTSVMPYPSISYEQVLNVILLSYEADYSIDPAPAGWIDGTYLGGILSTDNGRTWHPTRPLSDQYSGCNATETAHCLATINDTTYAYTTWTDAGDGVPGNQYFERGVVTAIQDTIFGPGYGIKENTKRTVFPTKLTVTPSLVSNACCVSFSTPQSGAAIIKLFDAAGRMIKTVFAGCLNSGQYDLRINTSQLPNGIYLLVLNSAVTQETTKFIKLH